MVVSLSYLGLLGLLPMSLSAAMTSEQVASLIASSENGDRYSQVRLGECYAEGNGVARDEAEAIRWYRLAAAAGEGRAYLMLGNAYRDGKGVAKDEVESYVCYVFSGDALGGREMDALDLNLAPELRQRCQQGVKAPAVDDERATSNRAMIAAMGVVTAKLLADRIARAWSSETLRQVRTGAFDKDVMGALLGVFGSRQYT